MAEPSSFPIAAVIGDPIAHSLSPRMHRYWLKAARLAGEYGPLHIKPADFADAIAMLPRLGFVGANVTLPHKEAAAAIADETEDAVEAMGAANMLTFLPDGRIEARNTDWIGFIEAVKAEAPLQAAARGRALVLGAGGAAAGIVYALQRESWASIVLANRTHEKAQALASRFQNDRLDIIPWAEKEEDLGDFDLIVNTTKLGMLGASSLNLDLASARKAAVMDIVYTPLRTPLLREAERCGLIAIDGLSMLMRQGAPAFQSWFGAAATVDEGLRAHLIEALERDGPA